MTDSEILQAILLQLQAINQATTSAYVVLAFVSVLTVAGAVVYITFKPIFSLILGRW